MAPTMEERLRSLKLKRAAFKLELLMFKEALDSCPPENHDVEIKNRLSDLATEFALFSKNQGELDAADDSGESMKERLEIKNAYLTYISRAQKLLQAAQASAAQHSLHERGISNTSASLEALENEISLPKLHLPQFSGQYEEWPGFADQFKSAVHENLRLNDCKKLMYLRSCLRGEASRVIDSLENSAANYRPAWTLLEERYNKPAVIVTNHIRALFNLPHLTKVTHSNLRPFLTDLESHYRALKTLEQPSADTLLIFLCLSRLDQETNLRWKEHTRDNAFPSLEVFCKFLHNRCQDIEPSGPAFSTRQTDVFKVRPQQQQFAPRPVQNVQHPFASRPVYNNNYTAQRVHVTTQVNCPLCAGPHAIYACDAFCAAPVSQRIKIASDKRLCPNCLKRGHTAATCNSSGCKLCHKKHNTLLHNDATVDPQPSTSRVNVACLNHAVESRVILSTAVIEIFDENHQPHRGRVLLDSCAQSNFITRQFAKKLNLHSYKTQIPVTGMNNMQSEITEYIKTRIQSRTTNFSAELEFLVAKQITGPLPHDVIDIKALQVPKNIPLADPGFHKPTTIDGLLGAQLFWHLLSVGQIKLAQPTVMLRKTLLGWLVVGETPSRTKSKSVICNLSINSLDKQLSSFVANRVSEIQQSADGVQWRHVPSQDNPADCLSRGVEPSELKNSNSWFAGPKWLRQAEGEWPLGVLLPVEVPERRTVVSLVTNTPATSFINRFSALRRLERTIAYCLRFSYALKTKQRQTGPLSLEEVKIARQRIIKVVQQAEFADDIKSLSKRPHSHKGKLQSLNPFLDENGILRVGGRIIKSDTTYDAKHSILIPAKHHFTTLIIRHEHLRHFHAGVLSTLNAVRQNYWPINGMQAVKQCIRTCVPCYRASPKMTNYQMGNLPKDRIIYNRPFLKVGIDYCGPLFIKEKRVRNTKTVKAYIAVFVCFSTKAVHLELVGDLTTDAFLAALKRFFARRGKSSDIYSDNAKTFVGADRELREVHSSFRASIADSVIQHYAINNSITWHFIPPRAPNFGGLWEAAVKQVKRHLVRSVGKTLLTYEAMTTYLSEIEAILNSRPLIPLTSDPNDFTALTPSHFLIGDLITSINESNVTDVPTSRLTMWQHVQQMKQHFWTRWHKDYLHHLTVRRKWHTNTPTEVKEGTLVILQEDNVPTMCWPLGRVIAVHPGDDSIARVATVKTVAGEYKRSIKRLSPLPVD